MRYSELILIDKACIEYLDMLINRPDTLKDLDSDPAEARSTEFLVEIPQEILTGIVE